MTSTERPSEGVWRRPNDKNYYISFRWHRQRHNYAAFTQAKLSADLRRDLLRLLERHDAGEVIDTGKVGKRCLQILVDLGVVEPPLTTNATELIDRYNRVLLAKQDTIEHANRTKRRLERLVADLSIPTIDKIKADAVQIWAGEMKCGITTQNHYIRAAKGWTRWLTEADYLPRDPLARLRLANAKKDKRVKRMVMSDADFAKLIASIKGDGKLPADARALTYKTARYGGFRAKEVSRLSTHSVEGDCLLLTAADTKNGKAVRQPIPSWLAAEIRQYANGRKGKLFPGLWWQRAAEMLAEDLAAAGIKRMDERGHKLDFHALRHTYCTGLARAKVHPKEAQKLARHSTITLTMDVYTAEPDLAELAATVEACMPPCMPPVCTGVHEEAPESTAKTA